VGDVVEDFKRATILTDMQERKEAQHEDYDRWHPPLTNLVKIN
jgi:hypothetical protein